jgi:hypothetical protein
MQRYAAADLIEAVHSLIRAEGARGKFELAENPGGLNRSMQHWPTFQY